MQFVARARLGWRALISAVLIVVLASIVVASSPVGSAGAALPARKSVVAYLPYWDQSRGFQSALAHADVLTDVSPWWYSVGPGGAVTEQWSGSTYVDLPNVRALQERGVRVMPVVTNHHDGNWDHATVSAVLNDPAARAAHVGNLVDLVVPNGFDGVTIDFEDLRSTDRAAFSQFAADLGLALHARGARLAVDVFAKDSDAGYDERNLAQDYAALGQAADQVRLMAYDWHWATSAAGPIAPVSWVDSVVAWAVTQIPRERVVLGNALYGYDWVGNAGTDLTWEDVLALTSTYGSQWNWDSASATPWFRYSTGGVQHEVWFENAASVSSKLAVARKHDVGGVDFWRLGGEDPEVWARVRDEYAAGGTTTTTTTAPTTTTTAPTTTTTTTTTVRPTTTTTVRPTTTTTIRPTTTTVAQSRLIKVSRYASRSSSQALSGTSASGRVYVFFPSEAGVDRVAWRLDDPTRARAPYHVEESAPWDLVGGTATTATAFDIATLAAGRHTVTASVTSTDGTVRVYHATWTVVR